MMKELIYLYSNLKKIEDEIIVGIDEAGRGPVAGPMVYAMFIQSNKEENNRLKDSKALTPIARERYFCFLKDYVYVSIDPMYITTHMEGKSKSLNIISMEAVVLLLEELVKKCTKVKRIYIDGLGNNVTYKNYLEKYFKFDFVIENKADERYGVVSKASIVAKVIRDRLVNKLECGSGYPSDDNTINWMKKNINNFNGFPNCIRYSWKTAKNLLPSKKSVKLKGRYSNFYIGKD